MNSTWDPGARPTNRVPMTMTVVDAAGEEQQRMIDRYDYEAKRYEPMLLDGEQVEWIVGDYRPHVSMRPGFAASEPTQRDCPQCGYPYFIARCARCNHEGV